MELTILKAVAWADIILCGIGQALVFVLGWAGFAGVLYLLIRKRRYSR